MNHTYHHGALRAGLLDAAGAILARDGLAALTLRAAAREAGVSHAAPTHHFRDLTGLLTALAAAGFVDFGDRLAAAADGAGRDPAARLLALGHAYVGFARDHPGLFQLMFRSERLDWSQPALVAAGEAAFALLTDGGSAPTGPDDALAVAIARWSLVHGLATLLLNGRLEALVDKAGGDLAATIAAALERLT